MSERAQSKGLWAAIITPSRGRPWVAHYTLASTKREARKLYLGGIPDPGLAKSYLANVRFAKVTITEQSKSWPLARTSTKRPLRNG